MGLKIKRVDLKKDGKSVFIEFEQSAASRAGEVVDTANKQLVYKAPHEDLTNRFLKMIPHLLYRCQLVQSLPTSEDWYDNYEFQQDDRFKGILVTGVIISGADRDMIKLIGRKTTDDKQVVPLNAPLIWLDEVGDKAYPLMSIFRANYEALLKEAEAYYNGKYAAEAQVELTF